MWRGLLNLLPWLDVIFFIKEGQPLSTALLVKTMFPTKITRRSPYYMNSANYQTLHACQHACYNIFSPHSCTFMLPTFSSSLIMTNLWRYKPIGPLQKVIKTNNCVFFVCFAKQHLMAFVIMTGAKSAVMWNITIKSMSGGLEVSRSVYQC